MFANTVITVLKNHINFCFSFFAGLISFIGKTSCWTESRLGVSVLQNLHRYFTQGINWKIAAIIDISLSLCLFVTS